MIFPVRANGERKMVECDFASHLDPAVLKQWKSVDASSRSNEQEDAVEFCESAVAKCTLYAEKGRLAGSEIEMVERSRREPDSETLGVLTVTASWWGDGQVLGFCQFRRTWTNNIVFDFLATHPRLLIGSPRPVSGVGTALLYRLALVGRALRANAIWAETTNISVHYYSALFDLKNLRDLFVLEAGVFYERLNARMI